MLSRPLAVSTSPLPVPVSAADATACMHDTWPETRGMTLKQVVERDVEDMEDVETAAPKRFALAYILGAPVMQMVEHHARERSDELPLPESESPLTRTRRVVEIEVDSLTAADAKQALKRARLELAEQEKRIDKLEREKRAGDTEKQIYRDECTALRKETHEQSQALSRQSSASSPFSPILETERVKWEKDDVSGKLVPRQEDLDRLVLSMKDVCKDTEQKRVVARILGLSKERFTGANGGSSLQKRSLRDCFLRNELSIDVWNDVAIDTELFLRLWAYCVNGSDPTDLTVPRASPHSEAQTREFLFSKKVLKKTVVPTHNHDGSEGCTLRTGCSPMLRGLDIGSGGSSADNSAHAGSNYSTAPTPASPSPFAASPTDTELPARRLSPCITRSPGPTHRSGAFKIPVATDLLGTADDTVNDADPWASESDDGADQVWLSNCTKEARARRATRNESISLDKERLAREADKWAPGSAAVAALGAGFYGSDVDARRDGIEAVPLPPAYPKEL